MSHERAAHGRALGRYILFDPIARGGMAAVHFGRLSGPVGFSRTVAIKRLHANFATDPEFVAMFVDEARLAARIRHPNVVPTLDVVSTGGEVFIVLEYVAGESLARLVRASSGPLPVRYALAIIASALHGLHAAHEVRDERGEPLGIVHRDVSPQNILVGADGVVRVIDFGVAKASGRLQETGDSGTLKGKVAYMAPEQVSGDEVSRRTDVYAASVVLWELLTGRRMIEGDNDAQRISRLMASGDTPFVPPSAFNGDVPAEVDALLGVGLAARPEDRFATAKEMAGRLEQLGGLVAPTELGEWVTRLASAALSERAELLYSIESSSSVSSPASVRSSLAVPAEAEPTVAAAPPVFVEDDGRPSGAGTPGSARTPGRTATLALLLALVALTAMAIGLVGWKRATVRAAAADRMESPVETGRSEQDAPRANATTTAEAPPPTTITSAAPAPGVSAPALGTETPSEAATTDPTLTAEAPSKDSKSAHGAKTSAPTKPTKTKPTKARGRVDCDPPYIIDADKHMVFKRECLDR